MNIHEYMHHTTWKNAATMLAGIFALASVQNTAHFFVGAGHDGLASWTLGIALGVALVIVAHFVGEADSRDRESFMWVSIAALFVAATSTAIQGHAYSLEMGNLGYLAAFAIVATGEFLIPLAVAKLELAKQRRQIIEADTQAEMIAVQTIVEVMSSIDTAKAKKDAQRQIERLISAHVGTTVQRLMPPAAGRTDDVTPATDIAADATPDRDQTPVCNTNDVPVLNAGRNTANDQKRAAADARRQELYRILMNEFNGVNSSDLNKTALAGRLDVTRQTISRDLSTLQETGLISLNGVVEVVR